ncbi:MAG: ABC transporter substrate-binding protein [Desulfovibrionaceae bacterium]|nr:ABC transporter substrate-binding protein [Desulfovibrionaceae bacterium]
MRTILNFCLVLLLAAGILAFSLAGAKAAPGPRDALEKVVEQVIDTLKQPGYANPATRPPLRDKIVSAVDTVFDFSEFSARTVGAKWQGFSADQQRRFDEAFARLLLATYLNSVQGYNGEKVDYVGEKLSPKGDRAEVSTIVTASSGKAIPVSYRMMLKNGKWVAYDVIIENVSLIKNYRSQFKEILLKGNPEELIKRVGEKAAEADKQTAKRP